MQDNDPNRENLFRDAGADPSDVNAGPNSRERGRGRARFSRNWREEPGAQEGGYGGRGRGRGGRGGAPYGESQNREYRPAVDGTHEDPPQEENSGVENRFRDPYFDTYRPYRGRRGGAQEGGSFNPRGRGRGRGRGNYYMDQSADQQGPMEENHQGPANPVNGVAPDGEGQQSSQGDNYNNAGERQGPREGQGQDWHAERGQRGGGGRGHGFKFEGRGRGSQRNDQRRGGFYQRDHDESNPTDRQDDTNNNGNDREEFQQRCGGGAPTNNYNSNYNNNVQDSRVQNDDRRDLPQDMASRSLPPAGKPQQRRQRAPHLRNNCRNEDVVLALFDCHHKQKGISLENYQNIPVEMVPRDIEPVDNFSELNVCPSLVENIERCGYKIPTPVQRYGIPVALKGNDLMACAQTGSGKTAAFLIPIVDYILVNGVSPARKGMSHPIGLVLAPTRELALQIFDEVRKITFRTDIFGDVVYGGTPYPSRFENDILVACPGRLSDMFERGLVSFSEIKFLVLDEADRMLEMGFEEQIEHLVSSRYSDMPKSDDRQTLMFSATFPQRILSLAKRYLRKHYYLLTVGRVGSTTKNITQVIERLESDEKVDRLFKLIYEHKKTDLVLVFVETKKAAEDLHRELNRENIPSATIHGDRRQQDRENALASFKNGETPILVATDVASRGLDIPDVTHVIQFDLPSEMDDYTHRIGRTGRAGNKGTATCFYTKNNRKICLDLFKYFSEHDQHVPSWFKEEAEQIEGEALLTRSSLGGNRGNRRRATEDDQGTWGDSCPPRATKSGGTKKKSFYVDDGGF